jgi:hypothetical protein
MTYLGVVLATADQPSRAVFRCKACKAVVSEPR